MALFKAAATPFAYWPMEFFLHIIIRHCQNRERKKGEIKRSKKKRQPAHKSNCIPLWIDKGWPIVSTIEMRVMHLMFALHWYSIQHWAQPSTDEIATDNMPLCTHFLCTLLFSLTFVQIFFVSISADFVRSWCGKCQRQIAKSVS